jgi:hypothetical protein
MTFVRTVFFHIFFGTSFMPNQYKRCANRGANWVHPNTRQTCYGLAVLLLLVYCHVFMAPWVIITGSGLDDWIYWQLLCAVSPNHNQLQKLTIFSRTLLPWLPRTRSFSFYNSDLIYDWTTYIVSRRNHRHTSVAQQWIYVNHIGNTAPLLLDLQSVT